MRNTVSRHPGRLAQKRKHEQGAALIVVVSILLVLTLVGLGAIRTSSQQFVYASNRTFELQAAQLAKAAIHRIAHEFRRDEINLLKLLLCKRAATATSQDPECDKAQTLCFNSASFFPRKSTAGFLGKVEHGGINVNSLIPYAPVTAGDAPKVWGDFRVRLHDPSIAIHSKPLPGSNLQTTNTYRVTATATGFIVAPNKKPTTDQHSHNYFLATRTYRANLLVMTRGSVGDAAACQ